MPASQRKPVYLDRTLDAEWNAVQRAELFAADHGIFSCAGLTAGALGVHLHESIQLRIQLLDAGQMRFHQFDRRQLFLADLLGHGNG